MQAVATSLLLAMVGLYAAASMLAPQSAAAPFVRAFAGAAIVGGLADWFAVTALFRRPLGLPIPHTAIIPREKERIGGALGRFIVENFLSARVLDTKLRELELAAWGGGWLSRPEHAQALAGRLVKLGPELLGALPSGAVQETVGAAALAAARAVPAAPTASALLAAAWNDGRAQTIIEAAAPRLAAWLSDNQDTVVEQVQAKSWSWMPSFVDRAIAKKITDGLLALLSEVQHADHPWRLQLAEWVERFIERLATDPEMRAQAEALKTQLLDDPRLRHQAARLWTEIERALTAEWRGGSAAAIETRLTGLIQALGEWMMSDPAVQRSLNLAARSVVRRVLLPRRDQIGRFVAEVVNGWDTRSMVERLELQVGPDLQFIRVNGTLVGGLAGLLLYALSRWAGLG